MKKAFIDYGHYNNNDSGAVGNGLREVDINVAYGRFLADELSANGVTVKIGKGGSLSARYNEANAWGCDIFISCHINAGGGDGFEVFHYPGSSKGNAAATKVYNQVVNVDKLNNGRGVKTANYAVLRGSNAPAILTELAFIDTKDIQCVDETHEQKAFGVSIAKGILAYLGMGYSQQSPTPQPTVNSVFEKAKEYNTPRCVELQSKLNKCGYNCGSVDGIYGEKTHNALGNFQAANGLVKDYLAGNNTFSKLDETIAKQNTTPTIKFNQKVKEIQEVCNKYGTNLVVDGLYGAKTEAAIKNLPLAGLPYRTPELTKWIQKSLSISQDGIFGANTDRKVKEYQKNNGLTVDGLVGFSTIKSMLGI